MNCSLHHNQAISHICIAQHKCQRKLCLECLCGHSVDVQLTMPQNIFIQLAAKKIEGYKLVKENSEQTKQHMDFKQLIANYKMIIKNLFEELKSKIKLLKDGIELIDKQYTQLLDNNPNLAESSYKDLEQLVQILNGTILNDWDAQKNSYANQISGIKNQLEQDINMFGKKVKEYIKQISLIFNQLSNQNIHRINKPMFKWNVEAKEINCLIWDYSWNKFVITQFTIAFTEKHELQYIKDGQIMRIDKVEDISIQPQVMQSLEQIINLYWSGSYGQNNKKIGRWSARWKGQNLGNVGGEYIDGRKSGQWKDLIQNYWSLAMVYEIGKYENDIRKGVWECVYENDKIGGGKYNDDGVKQGKWIDVFENFFKSAQITYDGEYNLRGMKVGRWDIMYCDPNRDGKYKQMQILMNLYEIFQIYNYIYSGGGSYDQEGNQKKIGKWIELDENFDVYKKVSYNGEYNIRGMKIGRWDIMYDRRGNGEYKQMQILMNLQEIFQIYNYSGGGSYDQEGNQKKIGQWVELFEGFRDIAQVTYYGEYNLKGMKVGRWDIMYCDPNRDGKYKQMQILMNLYEIFQIYNYSGGGSYDQEGNQKKIGKWIELDENFDVYKKVSYNGEYNIRGMKIGRWDIIYCKYDKKEYKQMQILMNLQEIFQIYNYSGGGLYDQEGNQKKIGKWVELDEGFNLMKLDHWDIINYKFDEEKFKQIENIQSDGELYDQQGQMVERQVELQQGCKDDYYVLQTGDYNRKGNKIGRWNFIWGKKGENEFTIVGGGFYQEYEECSKKSGHWVEMRNGFSQSCQVTYSGQYCNNSKIQRWDTYFEDKIIGGGSYDSQSLKNGVWTDLCEGFHQYNKVVSKGQYQSGKKIGQWDQFEIVKTNCSVEFKQIGEHYYNGEQIY